MNPDEPAVNRRYEPEHLHYPEERRRLMKEALREALLENGPASKAIVRQAIKEWLDEKYAQVGVWTLRALAAACVALIGYAILQQRGWRPPV